MIDKEETWTEKFIGNLSLLVLSFLAVLILGWVVL